jgi:hypothetical protein
MNTKQYEPQAETHILDSHIWRLDLEERGAICRCDWSAATNIVLQRAPLKEAHHRALVKSQTTDPSRNHDGRRCA